MKLKAFNILTVAGLIVAGTLVSCKSDPNSPGHEYMPDMYRSPAVEAYVDYGEVDGKYNEEAQLMVEKKFSYLAPLGTISYDQVGGIAPYNHGAPIGIDKSQGLFEVAQDANGLEDAKLDINPIPFTAETEKEGKELYGMHCVHCHDEKGGGQGTVIKNGNGKFPPPPGYQKRMSAGEMYYIITYGKNAMGSHASQVNPVERWKLVHYIEKLAGKNKEYEEVLYYSATTDTDGDGVMDNIDECPQTKGTKANNGCPAVAPETQVILDNVHLTLVFGSGSAVISEGSYPNLDRLIELMLAETGKSLIINGHTDNTGSASGNKALSLNRAQEVKAYMIEKGIDSKRIRVFGYGQNKPVEDNSTEEGRLANRRVEFRVFN